MPLALLSTSNSHRASAENPTLCLEAKSCGKYLSWPRNFQPATIQS